MTDLLRARLARREWTVTVEVVTPSPTDHATRSRILRLADNVREDHRIAAISLTDRTTSPDEDPIALAPEVSARAAKASLVHLAGKTRDRADVEHTLRQAADAGVAAVLLTGGDALPDWPTRGRGNCDAIDMLHAAREVRPGLLPLAVLASSPGRPLEEGWGRAATKRDAGAAAFIAQVTWEPEERETVAAWQTRLGVPVLGAVMLLTRRTLEFVEDNEITGLVVPSALRARLDRERPDIALLRLALDLVLLRRLGYAGVHISGLLTPALVAGVLDEAERLHATLGDDWRKVWRDAVGIA